MTTNVFDSNSGTIATDSRWSMPWGNRIIYVDDMRYEKVELYVNTAFVFAGKGALIDQWKQWIRSHPTDETNRPPHDGICVCVIDVSQNKVSFEHRQDIKREGAFFAGSGARHAAECWIKNRSARRSVESAKLVDNYSGGEVKFFETATRNTNLVAPTVQVTMKMLEDALLTRGSVMEITPNGAAPFKRLDLAAAANDLELSELKAKVANGDIGPEAPCDGMYSEWTPEHKSALSGVLGKVFGW